MMALVAVHWPLTRLASAPTCKVPDGWPKVTEVLSPPPAARLTRVPGTAAAVAIAAAEACLHGSGPDAVRLRYTLDGRDPFTCGKVSVRFDRFCGSGYSPLNVCVGPPLNFGPSGWEGD